MQRLTLDTPQSVKDALHLIKDTKDHFVLFDSTAEFGQLASTIAPLGCYARHGSDYNNWYGGMTFNAAAKAAIEGDMALVAKSDALLTKFERYAFETHGKAWRDDVVGALPNVPAFIAGHPLNMRRRVRQENAAAPLAIIVDTTISAMVSADTITRRGAAILALVRILSGRRPIELWACSMVDGAKDCVTVAARIDTTPLDLGTAAFALTHAAFPRRLCYGVAAIHRFHGGWPYKAGGAHRPHMAAIIKPAFQHVGEALCIEGMHGYDEAANEPERWLEQKLAELMPRDMAA